VRSHRRMDAWWIALCVAVASMWLGLASIGRMQAQENVDQFAPLERWRAAVLSGDAAAVKAFYSTEPAVMVFANGVKGDSSIDEMFWLEGKPSTLKLTMIASQVRHAMQQVIFTATGTRADGKSFTVTDQQSWQKQGEDWRIVSVIRTDAPVLKQPASMSKDLYPATADARADLAAAEKGAAQEHKRVLLVFGANWCFDCHVLDLAFQRPDLAAVLGSSYEVVHIDLGPDGKKNGDLVVQYQIPLNKGVPALAILESDGTLVVSNKNGEFENVRGMTPESVLAFLQQWTPATSMGNHQGH
jgi:thioredoxin 1